MYELIPLDRLPPGRAAEIDHLVGQPAQVRRLEEMGLRKGATVEVVRCGQPCIVRAGGNRLCFRCSEVLGVLVRDYWHVS